MRIVLDPGHGGKDPGAIGKSIGVKEKDIVLGIAKQLAEKLKLAGHEVFMTRDEDIFISLEERVKKFAMWKANFVLSIHINSAENTHSNYISAFLDDISNNMLLESAQKMVKACSAIMNWPDGGVREANYYVLKKTDIKVCLIELGFISNAEQEKLLARFETRSKLATALFRVINGEQSSKKINIFFEGQLVAQGIKIDGVTFVPLRKIVEKLGYKVIWDEKTSGIIISK